MSFELNDPVVIRRGGIDGFAQVSLAGIPGRICSTHSNALPGMVSVWVDWSKTPYANVSGLPNVINNFPADIAPDNEPPKIPLASLRSAGALSRVASGSTLKKTPGSTPDEPGSEPDDEPGSGPPALKLV